MVKLTRWHHLRRRAVVMFWTVMYFPLVPVFFAVVLPVYLYRFVISQLRKILRPDLDKLIHTRSSVLARDDYNNNPHWNLVVWLTLEGLLNLDRYRKEFLEEYVLKKDASSGELIYPEYQQHYERWMGFLFWRWEDNFDIDEHIRPYDGPYNSPIVDKARLVKIIKYLTWKPWEPRKSPWEFLQIPDYAHPPISNPADRDDLKKKSLLIFRIHHGIGDGYYILKLLMDDMSGVSLEKALGRPKYVRRNWIEKICYGFLFWIRAPYQFVELLIMTDDDNQWHLPLDKITKPMNAALTEPIKLEYIKSIKNIHQVSFSSLIYAAITGGIRNLMLERGIPIPGEMHTAIAVPMPGHPPKLRNHFIFSFISLPIGISDPIKRLKKMDENYNNLKRSTAPLVYFAKIPLVGALSTGMMTPMCINRFSTCLVSNFPGAPGPGDFKGMTPVLDMMFNAGLGEGSVGLGFTLISYLDHITLMSQADQGILPTDADVEILNQKILEELEVLKNINVPSF